jgi:hypothetical protein
VSLFVWLLPLDLSDMGDPTSSYATAGIALTVSGALKLHHHNRVEKHRWGLNKFIYPTFDILCLKRVLGYVIPGVGSFT